MKQVLRFLKNIWLLNFLRRIYQASTLFNHKYGQILKWGFRSNEDTNFTYDLTESSINYLANTIEVVTGIDRKLITEYIREAQNDSVLKQHIVEATKKSPFRKFADLEIHFGKRLGWYAFARAIKPKIVVETGVDKGMGSVLLCAALLKNRSEGFDGHYFGTDINPDAGYLLSGKYREIGEILFGDSIESLSEIEQNIDLFINDSDHSADYEYKEYLTIEQKISDRSILLGDNAHGTDKLALFSNKTGRNFLFYKEEPLNHWYPGAGIGISFVKK